MNISMKSIIGAGLGWTLLGPIGAIIGGVIGSKLDDKLIPSKGPRQQTSREDFYASLIIIFAFVIKADRKIDKNEVEYVKQYLMKSVSDTNFVQELMYLFKQVLEKDIDIEPVSRQISQHMDIPSRIQLIHLLFNLSLSDGSIDEAEKDAIQRITLGVGLNNLDYESIYASYFQKTDDAFYKILEISPDAGDEEVKQAYKRQALLYHPDKVSHLGKDLVATAEEKFKVINEAYQTIRSERGM